jgi:hypothetical protein
VFDSPAQPVAASNPANTAATTAANMVKKEIEIDAEARQIVSLTPIELDNPEPASLMLSGSLALIRGHCNSPFSEDSRYRAVRAGHSPAAH